MIARDCRVLVVEDDALVRQTLSLILLEWTDHADLVEDGAQAIARLEQAEFDVVVSDVRMPGATTGLELLQWLQRERPSLPVVLITGFALDEDAIVAQGVELLRKPFGPDELRAAVDRALRRSSR